jgi:hypothetical protein
MNKKNLALGAGGAIGAIIAWKMLTRAGAVDWETISGKIHHAENSHFAKLTARRFITRNSATKRIRRCF